MGGVARRYRDLAVLGEGGMGAVRLVHDGAREQPVALKRVLLPTPSALIRFKREFRGVERLLHPNLVRLYELGEDEEGPYFTMEVVDGVDLGRYCREGLGDPGSDAPLVAESGEVTRSRGTADTLDAMYAPTMEAPGPDAPARGVASSSAVDVATIQRRVAHTYPQILEGLSCLHAAGMVHRDLKPANVMVDRTGAVKLLDFGILASVSAPAEDAGRVAGTIGFMAPEQLRGADPEPASDLYALGAMLFLLVSGRLVFEGPPTTQMLAHLDATPPRLDELVPGVSVALADTCAALLAKDPAARPRLPELGQLLAAIGARPPVLALPRAHLAELRGREALSAELAASLEESLAGRPRLHVLRGASGTGKTAVAEHVVDRAARERGALVVRGRGRPNDRIAYNAIDGMIDQLAMALGRRRRLSPEVRQAAADAALMFPVLRDVAADSATPGRLAAFDGVVGLLRDAAQRGGLVLSIDDLQWADVDSVRLLSHLLDAGLERVAIVATLRDDVEPGPPAALVEERADVRVFDVGPLDADAVRAIAADAAREVGCEPDEAQLERAVELAGGRPFLAELAGRALGRATEAGLAPIVTEAVSEHAELLSLVLAADGWTRVGELASLAGRPVGLVEEAARELGQRGLLRRSGPAGPEGSVDLYHDTIRSELGRAAPAAARALAHGRFADSILGGGLGAPPQRLVRHLLGAGRGPEASRAALAAAVEAEAKLAYSLAADMYGVVIEHGGGLDPGVPKAHAQALERAGRYGDAVAAWERVAGDATGTAAALAALRTAHCLMASNAIDEGARRLDEALAAVGDPPLGTRNASGYLAGLAFLAGHEAGRLREAGAAPPEVLEKAECDADLGLLVGVLDPFAGARILRRARRGFATAGAAERVIWCDLLFAVFADATGGGAEAPRLARRYRARAERIRRERAPDDRGNDSLRSFLGGLDELRAGHWDAARAGFDACVERARSEGRRGRFEESYALIQRGTVDVIRQRPEQVAEALVTVSAVLRETGDAAMQAYLYVGHAMLAFWAGDLPTALGWFDEAIGALPRERPTLQRVVTWLFRTQPESYGQPTGALAALRDGELAFAKQNRLFRGNVRGLYGGMAALAHAAAVRAGHPLGDARLARTLAGRAEGMPGGAGDGERALAYLADARGRPEEALRLLELAETRATTHDRALSAAIARFQRGLRLGGDEGEALQADARRALEALGMHPFLLHEDPALRA